MTEDDDDDEWVSEEVVPTAQFAGEYTLEPNQRVVDLVTPWAAEYLETRGHADKTISVLAYTRFSKSKPKDVWIVIDFGIERKPPFKKGVFKHQVTQSYDMLEQASFSFKSFCVYWLDRAFIKLEEVLAEE